MADTIHLEIGGVEFSITNTSPVIFGEHDPAYRSFFKEGVEKGTGPDTIVIDVSLEIGEMPDLSNLERIFNSGQNWSMCKDGDIYWMIRQPPAFKKPFWAARFNRALKEIIVFCGEKLIREEDGNKVLSNPIHYPLDQILIMYALSGREGLVIHSAGTEFHGKGFVFPGPSGAGKSTLTRLLQEAKRENPLSSMALLSDERMIVRKIAGRFRAYGTPWLGEAEIAQNKNMPLSAVFFLCHSKTNRVKEIAPRQALDRILKVTTIPWYDRDVMPEVLGLCEDLISRVPLFELHFTPGREVVKLLEEFDPAK